MTKLLQAATVSEVLAAMAWEQAPDAMVSEHLALMDRILRDPPQYQELIRRANERQARPTIVCLCGSTRFWRDFMEWQDIESRAGKIVLTVGCFVHPPEGAGQGIYREVSPAEKEKLDELHLRKIDMADEVLILNRGGYLGASTKSELQYARKMHKRVRLLEPLKPEDREPVK
jgi:hypothetical protein